MERRHVGHILVLYTLPALGAIFYFLSSESLTLVYDQNQLSVNLQFTKINAVWIWYTNQRSDLHIIEA
jgi:hypothetical protein